jgi:peptidoglycan/LPS O-acetylase OafA/YrhL
MALRGIQIGLAGLLALRLSAGAISIDVAGYQIAGPSLVALSFASLVLLCLNLREESVPYALLTCSPFRIVAKYSYAIYLWHLVAAGIVAYGLNHAGLQYRLTGLWYGIAFFLLAFGLSFAAAAGSWAVIEQPALNFKDRFFPSVERPGSC